MRATSVWTLGHTPAWLSCPSALGSWNLRGMADVLRSLVSGCSVTRLVTVGGMAGSLQSSVFLTPRSALCPLVPSSCDSLATVSSLFLFHLRAPDGEDKDQQDPPQEVALDMSLSYIYKVSRLPPASPPSWKGRGAVPPCPAVGHHASFPRLLPRLATGLPVVPVPVPDPPATRPGDPPSSS